MNEPIWIDGEPANDAAAMADALEWLIGFSRFNARQLKGETKTRLEECIGELRKRLPADFVPEMEKPRT